MRALCRTFCQRVSDPPSHHFPSHVWIAAPQAFFLTAKVLHLGPVHVLAYRNQLAKQVQRLEDDSKQLERMLPGCADVIGEIRGCTLARMMLPCAGLTFTRMIAPSASPLVCLPGTICGLTAERCEWLSRRMEGPQAAMHRRQQKLILEHLDRYKGDLVLLDAHLQVTKMHPSIHCSHLSCLWCLEMMHSSRLHHGRQIYLRIRSVRWAG